MNILTYAPLKYMTSLLLCAEIFIANGSVNAEETTRPSLSIVAFSGVNKDPEQLREKDQALLRLSRLASSAMKVPSERLHLLAPSNSFLNNITGNSDAQQIQSTLKQAISRMGEKDTLLVYYVGQANIVKGKLRFNVPGPDFTQDDLALWLASTKNRKVIIVLDCPGAGLAVKALSAPNRVLIFGARSDQPHSTRFSKYFIQALCNPRADFNNDSRVSILESFQEAVRNIDELYREQELMKNETALIEDDGDAEPSQFPWRYKETAKDGALAAQTFLAYTDTVSDEFDSLTTSTSIQEDDGVDADASITTFTNSEVAP